MEPSQPTQPAQNDSGDTVHSQSPRKKWLLLVAAAVALLLIAFAFIWWQSSNNKAGAPSAGGRSTAVPQLDTEVLLSGRTHIWDIAFLPTKELLFTERQGAIHMLDNGQVRTLENIDDVNAVGEGGLMGLAVDPEFASNRYVYACFNTYDDIRVARWMVAPDLNSLTNREDIVTDMPVNPSGRHSGCRMAFGPDNYLWIGTGDTAQDVTPQPPQDPDSLGGKILRVDRYGRAAQGNPGGKYDDRIYSYGHRNTQGIAFFDEAVAGVLGISAEHGPSVNDEVNPLRSGNFGWAPPDGLYSESVSMTDTKRFPNAVEAIWKSGRPTQAPSGAAILKGGQWKAWDGAIALAMLKGQHLKVLTLNDQLEVQKETQLFEGTFGRLRAATLGPDGSLYVSTSNGRDDQIIKLTPR